MAENKEWPISYPLETDAAVNEMSLGGYNPNTLQEGVHQRRFSFSYLKSFFQGTLPSRVTAVENRADVIEDIVDPVTRSYSLTSGRIAMQEKASGTLTTSGWYTIAESDAVGFDSIFAELTTAFIGSSLHGLKVEVAVNRSNQARTLSNTTLKIVSRTGNTTIPSGSGFRLAKSDSVSTAGMKLQFNPAFSGSGVIVSQIMSNFNSRQASPSTGFYLVTPYLDDTPTLPDGVTSATFIEAGAELSCSSNVYVMPIRGFVVGQFSFRVAIDWGKIPKQTTTLTFNDPATNWIVTLGDGTIISITGITAGSPTYEENNLNALLTVSNDMTAHIGKSIGSFRTNGTGASLVLS